MVHVSSVGSEMVETEKQSLSSPSVLKTEGHRLGKNHSLLGLGHLLARNQTGKQHCVASISLCVVSIRLIIVAPIHYVAANLLLEKTNDTNTHSRITLDYTIIDTIRFMV